MTNMGTFILAGLHIRCILFDLGGTLWRRNKYVWPHLESTADRQAGKLLRTTLTATAFSGEEDEALGSRLREALNEHFRQRVCSAPHVEPSGADILHQVLGEWGVPDDNRQLSTALFEALRIRAIDSRILFDDSLPTLATLQEHGFQLGVVTNRLWGGPPFVEDLKAFGLLTYFDPDKLVISADVGLRKPTPEMYLRAMWAHQVAPEETVMVGDSLPADVVGPQQLGMWTIWKPKAMVTQMVKEHLGKYGFSLEQYNADSAVLLHSSARSHALEPLPSGMFDTKLADILHHADYWYQFLRGQIRPDAIIERPSNLSDVLIGAGGVPFHLSH